MKTILITNGNLSCLLALSDFLEEHIDDISAVFITTKLPGQQNNITGLFNILKRSGFAYTYFKIFTNIILPREFSKKGYPSNIKDYLKKKGVDIPLFYTGDINKPDILNHIRSFQPEVLLSFSSTVRFSNELIDIPSRSAINAHYALLPSYAGLSPYFWYLKNNENKCGVTLHQIVSKLDAGPIIEQRKFNLKPVTSTLGALIRQSELISPMLINYFRGVTHEDSAKEQDLSQRSYNKHPTRSDMEEFNLLGYTLFNQLDIKQIDGKLDTLNKKLNNE